MEKKSFGQVLCDLNLVTDEQLETAIEIQSQSDTPKTVADILLELGTIDEKTFQTIQKLQERGDVQEDQARDAYTGSDLAKKLQDADLIEFLKVAKQWGASDLYFGSNARPAIRHHGHLAHFPVEEISHERAESLIYRLLNQTQKKTFSEQHHVDLCTLHPEVGRFRLSLLRHQGGIAAIIRIIAEEIWPFEDLQLPDVVRDLATKRNGMVLVTGPTNSGKSTTLAALVDFINRNYERHIITIEDPIEVVHESKKSLISQREVNSHTASFAKALKSALREDPDVIVIGEMRDQETIGTAITAAETGHLVFGTLHTQTSYRTIARILDQFPAEKRSNVRTILSGTLRGIVSQQLVPCLHSKERVLAYEVMMVNNAISNLIREDRVYQIASTMQISQAEGMCLMDDSLLGLLNAGIISREEALSRAVEKEKFQTLDVS